MALPPIITNSTLFRLFTGTPAKAANQQPASIKTAAQQRDEVFISDDALARLQSDDIETADRARDAAASLRNSLEQNPGVLLGLSENAAF